MGDVRRVVVSLVAGLALLAAGCSRGDDPTVTSGSTIPGSSLGTAATVPPDTTLGGRPPIVAPPVAERAHLTDVRVGARSGGDRLVFQFDPVTPGYQIDFLTRPVTEDGSGAEVAVEGAAVLQVRLENAGTARFEGEKVILTYNGPKRIEGNGTSVVTEAVLIGDFEGVVSWAVGLKVRPETLNVSALASPSRLVVDIPATGAAS